MNLIGVALRDMRYEMLIATVNFVVNHIISCTPPDDVIEIAPEHDTYSIVEGNDLEVCIIVLSQSIMIEFEVIADIYHKCKSLTEDYIK